MHICEEIRRARRLGSTRCRVLDGRMNLAEAARSFALADDPAIYKAIGREEASAIAIHVLATELAYGANIMSAFRAADLWQRFMALFHGHDVSLFTNAAVDAQSWTPATDATFDMGILVIGATKAGCLWVEDED
jgi:hypothetical protein